MEPFNEHLKLVEKVLQRIAESNLKTNPLKCSWGVKETDFLGYEMTLTSCKPMKKKIDALLKMSTPSYFQQETNEELLGSYQLLQVYVAMTITCPRATYQAYWTGPFQLEACLPTSL